MFYAQTTIDLAKTKSALEQIRDNLFNTHSLAILAVCLVAGAVAGWLLAWLLRKVAGLAARRADASRNLVTVNRMRRIETWIILSVAILRMGLLIFALYIWWILTHEGGQANALIGASALMAVVIGGVLGPLLRDFAFGAGMMAEHWFGVGDLISIDFPNVQGVVERITLRSTRIRSLNGEVVWVANQTMNGVRVAKKGVRRTAIDIFASDPDAAERMVGRVNMLLPGGLSLLVSPLEVVDVSQRDAHIWHITAVGETAPGREWILEKSALEVFKKLDEKSKKPVLIVDPVSRYADIDMERQLARAVRNARKKRQRISYRQAVDTLTRPIIIQDLTAPSKPRPKNKQP
ncbi:MAG: mechanosensitive ion channel family protein [Candidatus Doudnabacteria bacterium]|nr:mechanosensitive ion channel family protein [Candidatus Doudnabacteria bacterium]